MNRLVGSLDGTWEKILDGLRAGCDEAEGPEWTVSADSMIARGHQHAAGPAAARDGRGGPRPRDGDKAYSSAGNRAWLRQHSIKTVIPVKDDQKKHRRNRGLAGGRRCSTPAGTNGATPSSAASARSRR